MRASSGKNTGRSSVSMMKAANADEKPGTAESAAASACLTLDCDPMPLAESGGPLLPLKKVDALPAALLAYRVGDYLEFAERSNCASASKAFRNAMASGTSHPLYSKLYAELSAFNSLSRTGEVHAGAGQPVSANELASARDRVKGAASMVMADRDKREKDERLRAPYAAARKKWASTLQQGFAARPENAITVSQTAQLLGELGRTEEAVAVLKWRMARAPRDSFAGRQLAEFLLQARAVDESIATARALLSLFPGDHRSHVIIARALLLQGDAPAALAEMSKAESVHDPLTLSMIEHSLGHEQESTEALNAYLSERRGLRKSAKLAEVHACRGEFSRVFECMDRAVRENIHDPELCQVTHSPFMDEIRHDERWLPLLRRMNRAPEQLGSIPFSFRLP